MGVLAGKDGRIQISDSSARGNYTGSSAGSSARAFMHTLLNMTNWSLSQPGPDVIDATCMGDNWKQYKIGIRDGGTISFSGFFNYKDSTGQKLLIDKFQAGTIIKYPGTPGTTEGYRFELWPSDDTGHSSGVGCWKFSTGSGTTTLRKELIVQSVNVGQDKSGLGSIDMTLKISDGYFAYSTALMTTP